MEVVNAVAKVRFNSARPKRVQLRKVASVSCDLLCLEPGQDLAGAGPCAYYVIAGTGALKVGAVAQGLSMGHLASCDPGEKHVLVNPSEQRLICLVIS